MSLQDRLHCPECKGRLAPAPPGGLRCSDCGRTIPAADGVADFVGDEAIPVNDPHRYGAHPSIGEAPIGGLLARVRGAAGNRWPGYLGDVLELGCGIGQMTEALVTTEPLRGLLAIDTAVENVRSCRQRLLSHRLPGDLTPAFAALSGSQHAIRDAIADTVLGVDVMTRIGDLRGFLATVHRVLKPGGRAWFIVPNRRYRQALCQAMAEAVVQTFARDQSWQQDARNAIGILARSRLLLVHQGDAGLLAGLEQKYLFDSEMLEDLAREVGFATAEMIPLSPDPFGADTVRALCMAAGFSEAFVSELAPLAASAGQPFFSLLGHQDSSDSMLLWLAKGSGPAVQTFSARPQPARPEFADAYRAGGGISVRWSVELLARETLSGVEVRVGGWCLANVDIRWVRVTLDNVSVDTPVWRPRPDVHEILNVAGLYHPLNALCSGLEATLPFEGVHPVNGWCPFRLQVVLANGIILSGRVPEALAMDEPCVINQ
jgi:SAM-dependent methyltransferase